VASEGKVKQRNESPAMTYRVQEGLKIGYTVGQGYSSKYGSATIHGCLALGGRVVTLRRFESFRMQNPSVVKG